MIVLAVAAPLALSGCSPGQLAATATTAMLSPETVATIAGICRKGEPLIRLAALVPSATVHEINGHVVGYCDQMLAGQVPTTTDGNTVNWLEQNFGGLASLVGAVLIRGAVS